MTNPEQSPVTTEKEKHKRKNILYFERRFELQYDNIENIEQVEELLLEVTKYPFKFDQTIIDQRSENDSLHFDMQAKVLFYNRYMPITKALLLLQGEAYLERQHLIIKGRVGFDRYPLAVQELALHLSIVIFGILVVVSMGSVADNCLVCGSVVVFVLLAIIFRPLTFRHDIVRRIERVFTDATKK